MTSDQLVEAGPPSLASASTLALQDAASVKVLWSVVRRIIDAAVPHHSLSFYFNYFSAGSAFRVLHDQQVPGSLVPWSERRRLSPAPEFLRHHPGIKTYRLRHMLPDAQTLFHSDYFTQVMRVEGWHSLLGLGFWNDDELVALLVLRRTPEQGEFSTHEEDFLEQLHPHVLRALRRIQRYESAAVLQSGLSTCLDALSVGVMMFDWNRRLAFKNHAAETLCLECVYGPERARQLHAGRSFVVPRAVEEALRTAKEKFLLEGEARVTAAAGSLQVSAQVIHRENLCLARPYLLVQIESARPARTTKNSVVLPGLSVLTRCEREVARHAAEGLSNGEIAARLGKSERTVAAQMGAVLAKLRIDSRIKLARLFD
jgi:DNA-binding CsgD family transcriptional regulator